MRKIKPFIKTFACLATFAVLFFSLTTNLFAQPEKASNGQTSKSEAISTTPKITQIDEIKIKELLKPNGKPLLINFWATWCIPCREEFPDLVEIDREFKGKIDFITITLDDLAEIDRDVPKFLLEMKAEMPTYLLTTTDENEVIGSISSDWQGGLPFTVLYNENGDVIHTKQGKIKPEIVKGKIKETLESKQITVSINLPQIVNLPDTRPIYTYEKGIEDAKKDIAKNKLIIHRYGFGPGSADGKKWLKEKYDIDLIDHGCLVFQGWGEYQKGYNETSLAEIKQRFGIEVAKSLGYKQ